MAIAKMLINMPHSYGEVLANIGGKSRKIGHNTTAEVLHDGPILVRYHGSVIATFFEDDTAIYMMAGWDTATTRGRIHALLPPSIRCGRINGQTYISSDSGGKLVFDGPIRVDLNSGEFAR